MHSLILSDFFKVSQNPNSTFWNSNTDWSDSSQVLALYQYWEYEMSLVEQNVEKLEIAAKAFLNDILKLKAKFPEHTIVFDTIQFNASAIMAATMMGLKILNHCFTWLCNGICDEISDERKREYHPYQIDFLLTSLNEFAIETVPSSFIIWTKALFYYSRSIGGLKELCLLYLDYYLEKLLNLKDVEHLLEDQVEAFFQIATWSEMHKNQPVKIRVCKKIEEIFNSSSDNSLKRKIAFFSLGPNKLIQATVKENGGI